MTKQKASLPHREIAMPMNQRARLFGAVGTATQKGAQEPMLAEAE
jgi:hypothetical protein